MFLHELEDEVAPEDRGHRVQVPVEAVEHEQLEGLENRAIRLRRSAVFFSASSTLLNGTNFSGSCIPRRRNVRV